MCFKNNCAVFKRKLRKTYIIYGEKKHYMFASGVQEVFSGNIIWLLTTSIPSLSRSCCIKLVPSKWNLPVKVLLVNNARCAGIFHIMTGVHCPITILADPGGSPKLLQWHNQLLFRADLHTGDNINSLKKLSAHSCFATNYTNFPNYVLLFEICENFWYWFIGI